MRLLMRLLMRFKKREGVSLEIIARNGNGDETLEILLRERHEPRNHINPCTKTPCVVKPY